MELKLSIVMFVSLGLSACNPKTAAIQDELKIIEKTAKDTTQPQVVRESAEILRTVLSEKQGLEKLKMRMAQWELLYSRSETTIATYVAFLKALEKKLPDELPSVEIYEAMDAKAGKAKIVEYNVGQTVIMMSNSLQNITLYNDPTADKEVDKILKRLTEKYAASETGKKILELLSMVHSHGLEERKSEHKPWKSPRKPAGRID